MPGAVSNRKRLLTRVLIHCTYTTINRTHFINSDISLFFRNISDDFFIVFCNDLFKLPGQIENVNRIRLSIEQ